MCRHILNDFYTLLAPTRNAPTSIKFDTLFNHTRQWVIGIHMYSGNWAEILLPQDCKPDVYPMHIFVLLTLFNMNKIFFIPINFYFLYITYHKNQSQILMNCHIEWIISTSNQNFYLLALIYWTPLISFLLAQRDIHFLTLTSLIFMSIIWIWFANLYFCLFLHKAQTFVFATSFDLSWFTIDIYNTENP